MNTNILKNQITCLLGSYVGEGVLPELQSELLEAVDKFLTEAKLESEEKDIVWEGKNRIVCAANLYADGTIILGARHFDQHMKARLEEIEPNKNWRGMGHEQGFIDRMGVFHSRESALEIAREANQIIRRCGGDKHELFSENLY